MSLIHARRNYPSSIDAALFADDVPLRVYDNLIATVRSRLAPLYDYFDLRRRVLGLQEIHHYDTYVPIVGEMQTNVDWDAAVDLVLAALTPLGCGIPRHARSRVARGPMVRPLREQG